MADLEFLKPSYTGGRAIVDTDATTPVPYLMVEPGRAHWLTDGALRYANGGVVNREGAFFPMIGNAPRLRVYAARLVAYEPAGERLAGALLDGVSWDASLPLNDVSALSLEYPDAVDPLGLSDAPVEIALQVSDGGDWVEPRNARFLSSEVQADLAAELDVPKYSFRGLGALLERPFVLRAADNPGKPYTNDDDDPKRNFLSASAGQIITSILNESRAKYPTMLNGITLGFSASKDSLGSNWNKLDSVAYSAGTDLLRVLDDMVARGICDWWLEGRTLMACNADKAAVHHSLRLNLLDVTESPLRATFENLASTVIVEGGQAKRWERPVSGASVPYGARVIRVANDSITTEGTALDLIARQALQATAPRREYTRTIALTGGPAPGISFECGDWVHAKAQGEAWEEVRVHELGLSYGHEDAVISARVTLNDRFVDAAVRDAKRMQGITHGTTQNLGDGGIPSKSDKATPAAPAGVAANSLGYWQDAVPLSSVDVSWQPVTADTNGLALNGVDYYEITCGGSTKRASGTTTGFDALQPSRIYPIQVRAISSTGIRGKWSATKEVLTAYPLPNLDPPTTPTLITSVGGLETRWDGKLRGTGAAYNPPKHFSHCLVEVQAEGETGWTRYARDTGWSLVGQQTGKTYRVRLVAVDMLGNESAPSPEATIKIKSEVQEALDKANEIATEQLVQREKVNQALEKALAAEGGVEGALQGITNLDKDLRPKITAAQKAADQTATDLAAAKVDITAAKELADAAFTGAPGSAAAQALAAAGGKSRNWYGPTAPTKAGGLAVGDSWFNGSKWQTCVTAPASGAATWRDMTPGAGYVDAINIGSGTAGNLEVGRLSAVSSEFQTAVITRLVGQTAFFNSILAEGIVVAGNGTNKVDAINIANGAITAPHIVASEALSAKIAEFLTVKASVIIGDDAAINTAFIDQLVGSDAFYDSVTTSRLVVAKKWWRITKSTGKASVSDSVVDATNTPQIRYSGGKAYIDDSGATSGANRGVSIVKGKAYLTAVGELGSTLLEPGSITTPMLVAQAVTAEKIQVGALDAFQITSPLIQSVSTANRGIKWTGSTFVAYNNSGEVMIRLDGNIGEITGMTITGGTVRTAATGRRVTLGATVSDNPAIYLYGSSGTKYRATLQVNSNDVGVLEFCDSTGTARLNLNSLGQFTAYSPTGTQALKLITSGTSVGTSTRVEFQGPSVSNVNGLIYMGSESVDGTMTQTAVVTIGGSARGSEYSFLRVTNGGAWYLGSAGSNTRGYLRLANDSGALQIHSRAGLYWWYNLPATTSAGQPLTMIVSGSGAPTIYRQSSLRADKTDIQDIDIDPYAVLKLRPRTFFDAGEWKRYMDGLEARMQRQEGLDVPESRALWEGTSKPRRIPGLIAEEVIEVIPDLGSWDDAGNLVGVQYERAPEYMLLAMIAMKKEIDELREWIGAPQ